MSMQRKLKKLYIKFITKARRLWDFFRHEDPLDTLLAQVKTAGKDAALSNQVVVITGSSAGVGLAVAKAFVQKGARVVLNGRNQTALDEAIKSFSNNRDQVIAVCADIATEEGAKSLLQATLSAFRRVDLLINNAGMLGPYQAKAWEISLADWQHVLDTNLTGPFLCAKTFMGWMVENQKAGRIINVSSGVTQSPYPSISPYATSKIALEGYTRNLALDADGTGIVVMGIQLGSTKSEMSKRFFKWEEYELLPPAESLAPLFWYAATADPGLLHGRIIASWRFNQVGEVEAQLAMPIAGVERFTFGEEPLPDTVPVEQRIILNRAENQFGAPDAVRALLGPAASNVDVSRYPDPDYSTLRNKLAEKHGLPASHFTFGNGSAELVERILRVFVKPGEAVISNDPSWFMFDRFAYMFGILNEKVPFIADASEVYNHNLNGILDKIRGDTRLIYLIHPSNPVGVPLLHEPFAEFLKQVPKHIPVVVDEAYVDFADRSGLLDTARLVKESDRMLIALRTFSKFYGLAGMRVGYGYATPNVIALMGRLELIFNMSSVSAEAAVAALGDQVHVARTHKNCIAERARIAEFLRSVELDFVPTQGNMMMFEVPAEAESFYRHAESAGVIVPRGVFMGRYTLWPIGLPAQNDRLMEIVRSII